MIYHCKKCKREWKSPADLLGVPKCCREYATEGPLPGSHRLEYATYLRGLAGKLMNVPVSYGTDQGDVDKLCEIANSLTE